MYIKFYSLILEVLETTPAQISMVHTQNMIKYVKSQRKHQSFPLSRNIINNTDHNAVKSEINKNRKALPYGNFKIYLTTLG